jgi:hypothetical protein
VPTLTRRQYRRHILLEFQPCCASSCRRPPLLDRRGAPSATHVGPGVTVTVNVVPVDSAPPALYPCTWVTPAVAGQRPWRRNPSAASDRAVGRSDRCSPRRWRAFGSPPARSRRIPGRRHPDRPSHPIREATPEPAGQTTPGNPTCSTSSQNRVADDADQTTYRSVGRVGCRRGARRPPVPAEPRPRLLLLHRVAGPSVASSNSRYPLGDASCIGGASQAFSSSAM